MATWRDGAEYAPIERPDGFATPRATPLENAPELADPAANQPRQAPAGFAPANQPAPPLDALVPATAPTRNPREAFDVGGQHSEGSAWGSVHSAPTQPFPMTASASSAPAWTPPPASPGSSSPFPNQPQNRFAPPTGPGLPAQIGQPGSLTQFPVQPGAVGKFPTDPNAVVALAKVVFSSIGWIWLAVLCVGVLIPQLSFPLIGTAAGLSMRSKLIASRPKLLRLHGITIAAALVLSLLSTNSSYLTNLGSWLRVMCIVVIVGGFVLGSKEVLQNQAPPNQTPPNQAPPNQNGPLGPPRP